MKLPWLNSATNVVYSLDGGPRKAPGTNTLNSSVIETSQAVRGIYDYWRLGTAGTTEMRLLSARSKYSL